MIVVGVVALLILFLRLMSAFFFHSIGKVDPRINLIEDRHTQIAEKQRQQQIQAFMAVNEGEVARTEERIREATALALVTSVFAANEALNRRVPTNTLELISRIKNFGLLPPGLEVVDATGEVSSRYAKARIRYRSEPLTIEILSVGKVPLDGPALLVRIPGSRSNDSEKQEAAALYIATTLEHLNVPPPFASEAEIFARGFTSEPLRAAKLTSR
jgi:hypothetical protein